MKDKLFLALMEAFSIHEEQSRMIFQRLNLSTGQPKVLYILRLNQGCLQKELAEFCQVKQPTMTVLLTNMEKGGLIRKDKTIVSGGKSALRIYLTDYGQKVAEEVVENIEKLEEVGFKGFTEDEKMQLLEMLGRVAENLK
jgi:DNA-binding MarR family transcriptional regulator